VSGRQKLDIEIPKTACGSGNAADTHQFTSARFRGHGVGKENCALIRQEKRPNASTKGGRISKPSPTPDNNRNASAWMQQMKKETGLDTKGKGAPACGRRWRPEEGQVGVDIEVPGKKSRV